MGLKKRDAKHIFCIDFHILMGYLIGKKTEKNMTGGHHQKT
jgi:hypothetical protein